MNILQIIMLWLISWILIIVIRGISLKKIDAFDSNEMVNDGNNLFSTGLFYVLGNVACYFIHNKVIAWVLLAVGVILCIIPIISSMRLMFSWGTAIRRKFTAIFAQTIPLIMAINIYFAYIM